MHTATPPPPLPQLSASLFAHALFSSPTSRRTFFVYMRQMECRNIVLVNGKHNFPISKLQIVFSAFVLCSPFLCVCEL